MMKGVFYMRNRLKWMYNIPALLACLLLLFIQGESFSVFNAGYDPVRLQGINTIINRSQVD